MNIKALIIEVLDGRAHAMTAAEIGLAVRAGLDDHAAEAVDLGEVEAALATMFMAGALSASYCTEPPRRGWEYALRPLPGRYFPAPASEQGRDAPLLCNCGPKTQGVTP